MASQIPYLDVQNLTKSFGALVLFQDINFSVGEGQKVALIAKNRHTVPDNEFQQTKCGVEKPSEDQTDDDAGEHEG